MPGIKITGKTILIQIVVFIVLLGVVEGVFRLMEDSFKKPFVALNLILHPYPYMMFGSRPGDGFTWLNVFTKENVPSKIVFNNYGFAERYDYTMIPDTEYLKKHGKKPGEKIVLITGGSVVHGVGATDNEKTIAGRMQYHLNRNSKDGPRYRVVNMGMGSWIAYQQFIGLSLFGLPLDPDWIVVMDGHNDAAVPCAHGGGATNPLGWPKFLNLTQGTGTTSNRLLRALTRRSALVRVIAGQAGSKEAYNAPGVVVDEGDPDPRFRIKMAGLTFKEQDKQLGFYLQAQRNVLSLFSRANVILSSQPVMGDNVISPFYRKAFSPGGTAQDSEELRKALDKYMAEHCGDSCKSTISGQLLGYFMGRSALELKELAKATQAADPSRNIIYINTECSIPGENSARMRYFVDNAHLSDAGQDRVGELFAEIILTLESRKKFDFAAFMDRHNR